MISDRFKEKLQSLGHSVENCKYQDNRRKDWAWHNSAYQCSKCGGIFTIRYTWELDCNCFDPQLRRWFIYDKDLTCSEFIIMSVIK